MSRDNDKIHDVTVRISKTSYERLCRIADESGLPPGRVATLLLEELIPTVKQVRTRLQIVREKSDA